MAPLTTHQSSEEHAPVELIVLDPHEPTRLGLGLLLQRESWVSRCLLAGSEDRAKVLARRHRPVAAVVDISQVGPFAGTVVSSIKEARPGIQVVLTSHCPGAVLASPRQLGAAAFVPAGTSAAETIATVRSSVFEEPVEEYVGQSAPSVLSKRERDVLALLATGATNREIAAQLYLGPDTVKKHASSLYRKLGVRNRTEATQQAAGLLAVG
jgi:two-component system response regulator DesR